MSNVHFTVLLGLFIVSVSLTAVLRRYALRRSIIDIPNERSSHTVPTPRGGGVAIVVSYLSFILAGGLIGWFPIFECAAMIGGGGLIAVIGFMDDHGHIAARWRLLGHFAGAALMIILLGGLPPIMVFGQVLELGLIGSVLAAIYLVWMLNLYNFMDGIDGLASAEAITACCTVAGVYIYLGHASEAFVLLALGASVLGFLIWNFPPAKIFMGDAGSGFLGLILGFLTLQGNRIDTQLLWVWLIVLGVFVVDATFTLLRRLARGSKVYEAHRSHAYQRASRRMGSHKIVTLVVILINLLWLMPLAVGVGVLGWEGTTITIIAYTPIVIGVWFLGAGRFDD